MRAAVGFDADEDPRPDPAVRHPGVGLARKRGEIRLTRNREVRPEAADARDLRRRRQIVLSRQRVEPERLPPRQDRDGAAAVEAVVDGEDDQDRADLAVLLPERAPVHRLQGGGHPRLRHRRQPRAAVRRGGDEDDAVREGLDGVDHTPGGEIACDRGAGGGGGDGGGGADGGHERDPSFSLKPRQGRRKGPGLALSARGAARGVWPPRIHRGG